jgi:hypothetical protein
MEIQQGMFLVASRLVTIRGPVYLGFYVKNIVGPLKGYGWAIISDQDQLVVVSNYSNTLKADCLFIVDGKTADRVMKAAGLKLVDMWDHSPTIEENLLESFGMDKPDPEEEEDD